MRKLFFTLLIIVGFLLSVEVLLRYVFGFCDALLYQHSDSYEYIAQPNQERYRFGAHSRYNAYSQRNDSNPDSTKVRVLGLGDSVIFGGTMIDQDSIATTLFSKETGMQMLNISGGSWGPDNCAAYLKEKGTFGASAMVLVCSSHDARDIMSHIAVVGKYPNYPVRQYKMAVWELMDRYLLPCIKGYFIQDIPRLDPDKVIVEHIENASVAPKSMMFNPGFYKLKTIADSVAIPFYIYLHAEQGEVYRGEYNEMGKQIISWAQEAGVSCYTGLAMGETVDMYRDVIHLNEKGQRHLSECLKKIIVINHINE